MEPDPPCFRFEEASTGGNETEGDGLTEASWGDAATTPAIDWRMSAALENVPRGGSDLAEVTSLEAAVRAWSDLDPTHRAAALLTPERAIVIDGVPTDSFGADGIAALAERLRAKDGVN